MEPSRKNLSAAVLLLLLLLVMAAEMGPVQAGEDGLCFTLSSRLRGLCLDSGHCADVCRDEEGFAGGECRGLLKRCYCCKPCPAAAARRSPVVS
ncbi:hypothetical protein ACP70R_019575 [Stipagrostis hirtigluma subsp. patula]